ncbi:MAG: hypothetical protein E7547_08765 [Ruminococcaceae bacterium]|nr:hypothetical protein [Oscillospiraceae bacterium]
MIHGGDYNPDQWIKTPEIWDEDMCLMKLAHVNSATINIALNLQCNILYNSL